MRRRLTSLLPLILVSGVLLAHLPGVAPSTTLAAQGNQGLQGGWSINDQGRFDFDYSLYRQYGYMQQAGAGWVRINFRLGRCFKDWTSRGCTGGTALEAYRQVVEAAQKANLRVLGLVSNESWTGGQSQWIARSAEATGGNGDNGYLQDFARKAVGVLAEQFDGENGWPMIDHWEIWNEPNAFAAPRGWPGKVTGGTYMYPSNFAWLLTHSHAQIRAANPTARVVSGGILSHDAFGSVDSGAAYLESVIRYGQNPNGPLRWQPGECPLDGVGQHLYLQQGEQLRDGSQLKTALDQVNAAYRGDCARTSPQTHVTELGWRSDVVGSDPQAANLETAYRTFRSLSYIARAFWFTVQDIPGQAPYGLVTTQPDVLKPSFAAYQRSAQ